MGPDSPLPLPAEFKNVDEYVESLLDFATSSWLLQTLCGGVHILDFYTRSPDLYSTILPESWRLWFEKRDIMDILDFLMREDLAQFDSVHDNWRGGPIPPHDLLQYIKDVRKHLLARDFTPTNANGSSGKSTIARHIAIGMKVKKVHEVDNFARYVDKLTSDIASSGKKEITHLVDFGSGQNYLGRALAAPPYSKHLIAVESKQHNIEGAKNMDVLAKLVEKPLVMRNKKEFRASLKKQGKWKKQRAREEDSGALEPSPNTSSTQTINIKIDEETNITRPPLTNGEEQRQENSVSSPVASADAHTSSNTTTRHLQVYTEGNGSVQYVEHIIKDGDLSPVVGQILDSSQIHDKTTNPISEPTNLTAVPKSTSPNLMVMSLHSCGNLVHHGLRSLLLNPAVSAVAMVGCCYNLVTERLGPPTYKLPTLRPNHPRLVSTSNAYDPHGFPMSEHLANYPLPHTPSSTSPTDPPRGIRLNITARMMAVQAPFNWGRNDSELFFTRHFYRALLQRIFLDRGVVSAPTISSNNDHNDNEVVSASGHSSRVNWTPPNGRGPGLSSNGTATPLTIGTLRKFAYVDFVSYVRAAVAKLTTPNTFCEVDPGFIQEKMDGLTDAEIRDYEQRFAERKKELSIMWSLMAFSAGVVEAIIVTDRWLWLGEQECVERAWVEPVFEYGLSPRNLVVVGIKK
ncbi:methyltransferase domain-containing protein [Dendryphion nanum]|uniref:Methyltransferase domain-containing protein n=1 Tax=Dendryphion nanum TaxID=256645 RepID=A0A9P9EB46_9PLEO|nr:methyltransferase domain-containing protein [Dendryphion nanum]